MQDGDAATNGHVVLVRHRPILTPVWFTTDVVTIMSTKTAKREGFADNTIARFLRFDTMRCLISDGQVLPTEMED